MEGLLQQMAVLMKQKSEEPDLLSDEPGYDDFISASNFEYETKNYKHAKVYYEKACQAGHPMGLVNYALWFLEGKHSGVDKDLHRAFDMFQKAAEKGLGMANYNLALFYYEGKGEVVEQNHAKAFKLAKAAIKDKRLEQMRQPGAWYLLGKMYMVGEGTFKCIAKAKAMFEKAGELGHPGADSRMLGMMSLLEQVSGVDKQRETDNRWDKMCDWQKKHPEEKCETIGDHFKMLNKFGFQLVGKTLTKKELTIKGGFDVFMEVSGGQLSMLDHYEMEDAPLAPKTCDFCGKEGAKKRCGRCGEYYCSQECQKKDWKSHKSVCQAVVDALS